MRELWIVAVIIIICIVAVALKNHYELSTRYAVSGIVKAGLTELLTDAEKTWGKHYISERR